jgi:peptidoglycan/xylan/chitin deacetylase (PgdA/CDA1 family)
MTTGLSKRSAVRARIKTLWAGLLRISGLLFLARRWVRRHGVIVLTFHRVLGDAELKQTASLLGMLVREQTFGDFLKYAAEKYELLDISSGPDWRHGSKVKLAITFDDGWSDNATIARRYGIPMVIFIVSETMGLTLPFWPERVVSALSNGKDISYVEQTIESLKRLPAEERDQRVRQLVAEHGTPESLPHVDRTMTWEQAGELDRHGVVFGSHTSTHEILTTIPPAQAEEEIAGSRERIEQKLGKPCRLFSYPNGDCSVEVRKLVQRTGYKFAFLNQDPCVWTRDCDPFLVPRVNVCEYHLIDAKGKFSPLTFDYAVVWSAAKGLMRQMWRKNPSKGENPARSRAHQQSTNGTKEHEGFPS